MKRLLRLLQWLLKAAVFFTLFAFALNNQGDVTLHLFFGLQWQAPLVLVLLLKEVFQPLTILAALVLSVPGAFLALFITGSTLSLPAMIGLIMLMGIATKNSILLIDYIIIARSEHQLSQKDAIVDACRKRVRPIVMTTVAMGAGMLPIALGMGGDPSFRAPMAIVVIGGLISSTFLSVLVIPVLYSYVDDGVRRLKRLISRNQITATPATRNQSL